MRIIGGKFKGRILKVPSGLPVRPTTDFAKEGLFNILLNKIAYEDLNMLDLFAGTGHISYEFASRGADSVTCVDQNFKCCGFIRTISDELNLNIQVVKQDVFSFLRSTPNKFNLIFADPPYDLENINEIHQIIIEKQLLISGGWLIIEHGPKTNLEALAGFVEKRKYGNVNFSFFTN